MEILPAEWEDIHPVLLKPDGSRIKYIKREEVRSLLEVCTKERDKLIVLTLWNTGIRVSEMLQLTPSSFNFSDPSLTVRSLKKKKIYFRTIPLNPEYSGMVASYCMSKGFKMDQRIFPLSRIRVFQILQDLGSRAGIPGDLCHPHAFRHGFAVNAVLSGVPPLVLRRWLGHSKIDTTLIYTEVLAKDTREYIKNMRF